MKTYITNAGLGYREYANLLRLEKTETGYNYLIIDLHTNNDDYSVGQVIDLEDIYVTEGSFKIEKSELYGTFLFQFFLKNYNPEYKLKM